MKNTAITKRMNRKKRVGMKIFGTQARPRISVFRSQKYIYAQVIDDEKRKTIASVNEKELPATEEKTKMERAQALGELLGKKMQKGKLGKAIFDRNGYRYHGRVKAFAQGVRDGGIEV